MDKVTDAEIMQWYPLVYKMAKRFVRRLPEPTLFDDLVSVGLVGVWNGLAKYDGKGSLKCWLVMLVRQHMIRFCRSEVRRGMKRVDRSNPPTVTAFSDFACADGMEPFQAMIADAHTDRESWTERQWEEVLSGASPKVASVITQVYRESKNMKQLGEVFGCNNKAASQRHQWSIRKLREILAERGITRMEQVA